MIDPANQPREVARFAATLTVENEAGERRRYRIVGDISTLHTLAGEEELTVVSIEYS